MLYKKDIIIITRLGGGGGGSGRIMEPETARAELSNKHRQPDQQSFHNWNNIKKHKASIRQATS